MAEFSAVTTCPLVCCACRIDHHFKVPSRIIGAGKCLLTVQCASTSNKIAMIELPSGTNLYANLGILVSLVDRCKRFKALVSVAVVELRSICA